MGSKEKKPSDDMIEAVASLAKGNELHLRNEGVSQIIIRKILHIMNNYFISPSDVFNKIIAACLSSHAPEKAFLRFERFLESAGSGMEIVSHTPELPIILASVFSSSGALSNRLNGDLYLIGMISGLEKPLLPHFDKEYYLKSIRSPEENNPVPSERIKAIHRIQTVQLMRICARNANPETPIAEINTELSSLAEAVIESCLAFAADELMERIGIEHRTHNLVVLGLGKLGGHELNVSSDIDLIYLCGESDESWGQYDNRSFHTMLAGRLTTLLSESTEHGALYRVDTRLRADGLSGPLVRSTRDYFRYLEMRGEAWERQMLLKARTAAGARVIGEQFLESLEHFIFPAGITRSPHREIIEIKNRIEARITAEGSKKTHLKLMPGGIRDIEFIVQCLQLLMGGIHPEVRCTGTLPSLDLLRDYGALNTEEHAILTSAYTLYRKIENALQWRELQPAFTLPDSPDELSGLAGYLRFAHDAVNPGSSLLKELERIRTSVRAIYNDIFSVDSDGSFEEMALYTVIHPTDSEKVRRFMESCGFHNPMDSARNLSILALGEFNGFHETALHSSVERFLPRLLRALSDLPDPSGALERFQRVVESYNARTILFDILNENQAFFELLLSITHSSVFITDIVVNDPSLLDWLVEVGGILHPIEVKGIRKELERINADKRSDESFTRSCLALKNREELRIGSRDITGLATTAETFSELTAAAEHIVKAAFKRAINAMSLSGDTGKRYAFSVISAGKLGAGMMDFGSDLDLIFVYKGNVGGKSAVETPEYSIRLAQHILSLITGGGGVHKVYDVDARLRPEGGSSVLAVSLDEYRKYLMKRASVWERLALVRARHVAGMAKLGSEIIETLNGFIYRAPFSPSEIEKIMDIRANMTANSKKRYPGIINIKSGCGGIADIDFIAQSYAAHYGAGIPAVRHRETPHILNALVSEKIVDRHDAATLKNAYFFLCDVEKALRIGSGRPVNIVSGSETETARISQLLGFKNTARFRKRLEDVLTLTRELYNRLMKELFQRTADEQK